MAGQSRLAHRAAVEVLRQRITLHLKKTGTKGKDLARQLDMPGATLSSLRTGKRPCGPYLLGKIQQGLDRIGVPECPTTPVTVEYDLLPAMRSIIELGVVSSCTLSELVFVAALPQQEGYPTRRLEVDMSHIANFAFDLLPLMKVIVGSKSAACTVVDLLGFLYAREHLDKKE